MPRDPLAYVVELVVAPRIIATSFQGKPPVGNRVAQLGSGPVRETCHEDGACHGVITVSWRSGKPAALQQMIVERRVVSPWLAYSPWLVVGQVSGEGSGSHNDRRKPPTSVRSRSTSAARRAPSRTTGVASIPCSIAARMEKPTAPKPSRSSTSVVSKPASSSSRWPAQVCRCVHIAHARRTVRALASVCGVTSGLGRRDGTPGRADRRRSAPSPEFRCLRHLAMLCATGDRRGRIAATAWPAQILVSSCSP